MDEKLLTLLDKAKSEGYNDDQLKELIGWYKQNLSKQDSTIKPVESNYTKYSSEAPVQSNEDPWYSDITDTGKSLASGAVGLAKDAVAIADLGASLSPVVMSANYQQFAKGNRPTPFPTFGGTQRDIDSLTTSLFGGTMDDVQNYLRSNLSEATKASQANVESAEGFWGTLGAYATNPRALTADVVESLPASLGGGIGVGRAALKTFGSGLIKRIGPQGAAILAAGIGEGTIATGAFLDEIRQAEENGDISAKQAGYAVLSGGLTGALGILGGKIANQLGVLDPDLLFTLGRKGAIQNLTGEAKTNFVKKLYTVLKSGIAGGLSEGVLEEMPQSAQETYYMNVAQGKEDPWEGVAESMAAGLAAGFAMGDVISTFGAAVAKDPKSKVEDKIAVADEIVKQSMRDVTNATPESLNKDENELVALAKAAKEKADKIEAEEEKAKETKPKIDTAKVQELLGETEEKAEEPVKEKKEKKEKEVKLNRGEYYEVLFNQAEEEKKQEVLNTLEEELDKEETDVLRLMGEMTTLEDPAQAKTIMAQVSEKQANAKRLRSKRNKFVREVEKINKLKQEEEQKNAVQEQKPDEVSVQSKTGDSGKVEGGVSKPRPQSVKKQSKAPETKTQKKESSKVKRSEVKVVKTEYEKSLEKMSDDDLIAELNDQLYDYETYKNTNPEYAPVAKNKAYKVEAEINKRAESKVKTPEGTINLETGEVKLPSKKRGRPKKAVPTTEAGKAIKEEVKAKKLEKKAAQPKEEDIQAENVKLRERFNAMKKLDRDARKRERMPSLLEAIDKSPFASAHKELRDEIQKELDKLNKDVEDRVEARAIREEKQAKREEANPKIEQSEEQLAKITELEFKVTELEKKKSGVTEKYGALRDKRGNILKPAVPQKKSIDEEIDSIKLEIKALETRKKNLKDKAPEAMTSKIEMLKASQSAFEAAKAKGTKEIDVWEAQDLAVIRAINMELEDTRQELAKLKMTPEQVKVSEDLQTEGLTEEDADNISTVETLDFIGGKPEDYKHIGDSYKNLSYLTESEFSNKIFGNVSNVFKPVVNGVLEIINTFNKYSGFSIKYLEADPTSKRSPAGTAAFGGNRRTFYIITLRDGNFTSEDILTPGQAKFHELMHILDYINKLIAGRGDLAQGFAQRVNNAQRELNNLTNKTRDLILQDLQEVLESDNDKTLTTRQKVLVQWLTDAFYGKSNTGKKTTISKADISDIISSISKVLSDPSTDSLGGSNIYGLTNVREFVVEAMTNPIFANILSRYSLSTRAGKPKTNVIKELYSIFLDYVNSLFNQLNKVFGSKIRELSISEGYSVLDHTMSLLDSELDATESILNLGQLGVEEYLNQIGNLDLYDYGMVDGSMLARKPISESQKEKSKASAKLSRSLFNKIVDAGIKDKEAMKTFLNDTEQKIGVPISNAVKTGAIRRALNYYKRYDFLDKTLSKLKSNPALKNAVTSSKATTDYYEMLERLNIKDLRRSDIKWVNDALVALFAGDNQAMNKQIAKLQRKIAQRGVNVISDPKFKFKTFKRMFEKFTLASMANFPTFISYISDYTAEAGGALMRVFHQPIQNSIKNSTLEHNDYISKLNELAKDKLTTTNFRRIYYFGQLVSNNPSRPKTLEKKYQELREQAELRLRAAGDKKLTGTTVEDVQLEIEELNKIYSDIVAGTPALTKDEGAYYKKMREILDEMLIDAKDNAEIIHGEKFEEIENYVPMVPIGTEPVMLLEQAEEGGDTTNQIVIDGAVPLDQVARPFPNYGDLSLSQGLNEIARKGGKGVYYETNVHYVMNRYLKSELYNINISNESKIMTKMFRGKEGVQLKRVLGSENTTRIYDYLEYAIRYGRKAAPDHDTFTKGLLDLVNKYQTAKIGTSGQFVTQLLAMVPAITYQTGAKNTSKAVDFMIKANTSNEVTKDGVEYKTRLRQILSSSSHLDIRDFFFEKFESIDEIAKEGTAGKLRRFSSAAEKKTVTGVMSYSDRLAASLNFISAMIEAGADPLEPKTWTADKVAKADLKTMQLQNVSSAAFTAPLLRPAENSASAILMKSQFAFKSFSMNAMMNSILSAPQVLKNKGAREIFVAHLMSNVAFEGLSKATRYYIYYNAALLVASALGADPPERKEGQTVMDWVKDITINTFINNFFGGLPSSADAIAKYVGNGAYVMATGEEQDVVYTPKDFSQLSSRIMGVYSGMMSPIVDFGVMMTDMRQGKNVSDDRFYKTIGKVLADVILFSTVIPFRGDIAKTAQTYYGVKGEIERENKEVSQSRNKIRKSNKRRTTTNKLRKQ